MRLVQKHGFTQWGYLPRVATLDGVDRDVVVGGAPSSTPGLSSL